jgi:SAM-dependent methyltransferase
MEAELFTDLADIYEAMIDWPKRLAHEEPFFRRWFAHVGAQSVLDTACGTGRHAAMFHSWQIRVEGADVSEAMIGRARALFGHHDGLRFSVRGFDEPFAPQEPPDVAVCVGNSLALAADLIVVRDAIGCMLSAVRPGGLLIVQVLNLWRLDDGPCVWQKCLRTTLPRGDVLVLKGVHRSGPRGFVDVTVAGLPDGPLLRCESVPFLGLEAGDLGQMALECGASRIAFFGGYQEQPYDRRQSADLVMVAEK